MEIDPELIAAFELVEWAILALPGVVGVGIGLREENGELFDELAIRVYVADISQVPFGIPEEVGGVGVCLVEAIIEPCNCRSGVFQDDHRYDKIVGGIKIIHPRIKAGTLGAVVQDQRLFPFELLGLSCFHVVGDENALFPDTIWQPDHPPLHAPPIPEHNNIGSVVRVDFPQTPPLPFSPVVAGLVDAAVFTLRPALVQGRTLSPKIIGQDFPAILVDRITATTVPTKGLEVRKRGFMTRVTEGFIIDDFATFQWTAGPSNSYLIHQAVVTGSSSNPGGVFCCDGDSGSLVVDKHSPTTAVGLLWGMSDDGRRGYVSHIRNVESQLGVKMAWF